MATDQTTDSRTATKQRDAFGQLARDGVYSDDFAHPQPAREFFASILTGISGATSPRLRILDCGCGTGAWLAEAWALLAPDDSRQLELYGFDLTAEMVAIAADKLGRLTDAVAVHEGDILNAASYRFDGNDRYDIVFAYDVVQQLPRARQADAVRTMLAHLAPGGRAIIFDHEHTSAYGLRMARRKFFTRYFRLPLVPRYYCNARYPYLKKISAQLEADGYDEISLVADSRDRKYALTIRAPGR